MVTAVHARQGPTGAGPKLCRSAGARGWGSRLGHLGDLTSLGGGGRSLCKLVCGGRGCSPSLHCGLRYTKKPTGSDFVSNIIKGVLLVLRLFLDLIWNYEDLKMYLVILSTIKQNLRYSPEKHCISGLVPVLLLIHSALLD